VYNYLVTLIITIPMPELPYGAPFQSDEPIPLERPRYNRCHLVGMMPHWCVTLNEKEVIGDESATSIMELSPGGVEKDKDDAGKDGKLSGLLRIMTCGAGLFSDGYLNGVRKANSEYAFWRRLSRWGAGHRPS